MTRRLSLLAGHGQLVREAADAALAKSWAVQVIDLVGRPDISDLDTTQTPPSNPLGIWMALRKFKPTHICMIGAVRLSDGDRHGLMRFLHGKSKNSPTPGDSGLSKLAGMLEFTTGASVVGIHQIVNGLLAPSGRIAGPALSSKSQSAARHAMQTAHAVGHLDAGQAIVMAGERVIAIEDIAGTDALVERVRQFTRDGLTGDGIDPLVLAKCRKPGQPVNVDLPAIGPDTIERAHEAGISVIAVQTGQTLLIGRETIIARAELLGVSVMGIDADNDPNQ